MTNVELTRAFFVAIVFFIAGFITGSEWVMMLWSHYLKRKDESDGPPKQTTS